MRLEPVRPEDREAALALYLEAFPEWERAEPGKLESHVGRGLAEALGIYGEGLEGLMYVLPGESLVFLLYFAVAPGSRGRGVGTEAASLLLGRYPGRRVFLNVEPPDEGCPNMSQRLSRMRFYSRLGFEPAGRLHCDDGDFLTLVRGGAMSPEEMESFRREADLGSLFEGGVRLVPE